MLATSWNCSKRLTGRKVRILYLEVLMQLLCGNRRGDNERGTPPPNLEPGWGYLFLYTSQTCAHSLAPRYGTGKRRRERKSLQADVFCFSDRKPEKFSPAADGNWPKIFLASPKHPSPSHQPQISQYSSLPALEREHLPHTGISHCIHGH